MGWLLICLRKKKRGWEKYSIRLKHLEVCRSSLLEEGDKPQDWAVLSEKYLEMFGRVGRKTNELREKNIKWSKNGRPTIMAWSLAFLLSLSQPTHSSWIRRSPVQRLSLWLGPFGLRWRSPLVRCSHDNSGHCSGRAHRKPLRRLGRECAIWQCNSSH